MFLKPSDSEQTSGTKKIISFDNSVRGIELEDDVTEVELTGVNGKRILFARGNFNISEIDSDTGCIPKNNLSYISYNSNNYSESRGLSLMPQLTTEDFIPGETTRNFLIYDDSQYIERTFTALCAKKTLEYKQY